MVIGIHLFRHFLRCQRTPSPQVREHVLHGPQTLQRGYFLCLKLFDAFWVGGSRFGNGNGGNTILSASISAVVFADCVVIDIAVISNVEFWLNKTSFGDKVGWWSLGIFSAKLFLTFPLRKEWSLNHSLCF